MSIVDQPMQAEWTPTPFNLTGGNPFPYSDHAISVISATEAFETGINRRDNEKCVVCGEAKWVEHAHIIPKSEPETWKKMRKVHFIPRQAKSVAHEARNGMLLCRNHHWAFDHHYFYIRWVPEAKCFVFINQSQIQTLERYHGRAINLCPGDRLPFHGAFLVHEMRVRGYWPFHEDRSIFLPILQPNWDPVDGSDDDGSDDDDDNGHNTSNAATGQQPKTFIPTNPFSNPAELQAMKDSFAKQPNWKSAVIEGETWEGTAEQNVNKWRGLMGNHE